MSVAPWAAWREPSLERDLLDAITLDAPWMLVERFAGLVRESGGEEEAEAVRAITARLDEWGVAYELHRPVCWISLPRASALEVYAGSAAGGYAGGGPSLRSGGGYGRGARTVAAKTPAMGRSTEGEPLRGALVHLPAE